MTLAQFVLALGALIAGFGGPGVGLYLARGKRGLDKATTDNITNQVDERLENRHRQRYNRLVALEEYADDVQVYTHQVQVYSIAVNVLLQRAYDSGLINGSFSIPEVPAPPRVPLSRNYDDKADPAG